MNKVLLLIMALINAVLLHADTTTVKDTTTTITAAKIKTVSNVVSLFNEFNTGKPRKGKFEKTDDYQKRFNDYLKKYSSSIFINVSAKSEYDADNERVWFGIKEIEVNGIRTIITLENTKYIKSYLGQNAFGVKKEISKYKTIRYCIGQLYQNNDGAIDIDNDLAFEKTTVYLNDIKPKEAKILLPRLGLLYELEKLSDEETNDEVETPTIDEPNEINYVSRILYVKIKALYVYNKITKDVYMKIALDKKTQ